MASLHSKTSKRSILQTREEAAVGNDGDNRSQHPKPPSYDTRSDGPSAGRPAARNIFGSPQGVHDSPTGRLVGAFPIEKDGRNDETSPGTAGVLCWKGSTWGVGFGDGFGEGHASSVRSLIITKGDFNSPTHARDAHESIRKEIDTLPADGFGNARLPNTD